MPVESAADLAGLFHAAEFGEAVTFTPVSTGVGETVVAIVDRPVRNAAAEFRGVSDLMTSRAPLSLRLPLAALSVAPLSGDGFTVDGTAYTVDGKPERDLSGKVVVVYLKKA